jgi:hypothetical protein
MKNVSRDLYNEQDQENKFLIFVCGIGDGTQGLTHTRHTFYPWATLPYHIRF